MVDYSKWDKLDLSDAEEEPSNKPRVQRFDAPQQVTFGGSSNGRGGDVELRPSQASRDAGEAAEEGIDCEDEPMEPADEDIVDGEDTREYVLECRALAERALKKGDAAEAVRLLEKAMGLGGAQCPGLGDVLASAKEKLASARGAQGAAGATPPGSAAGARAGPPAAAAGGVVDDRYSWSQTKDSVMVDVFVPEGTKAKDVSVIISETEVGVKVKGSRVFGGQLEFKVEVEEDPDWEMKSSAGRRAVRLTLKKAPLPGGLSIITWWSRVLKGDPSIDVQKIEGRKDPAGGAKFAEVWKEAHSKFRDQVKNRQPIPIDVNMGDS